MEEKLNLKQIRLVRGLSQEDMADRLNIHVNTYRQWESEPLKVTVGNAFKIAEILNVSVESIFFDS